MSDDPVIIAQHREQLANLLTEPAKIEHDLMCCYLFAAYGLKRCAADGGTGGEAAAVVRLRGAIAGIPIEEILYLSLVSSLLDDGSARPPA